MLTLAEGYDRNTEDYVHEICIIHIPLWRIMKNTVLHHAKYIV
ncbi:hypothetical protein [Paenibacillus illinoisensis]|nr:hypothetical protein [Paenibacillus illinoisensis]